MRLVRDGSSFHRRFASYTGHSSETGCDKIDDDQRLLNLLSLKKILQKAAKRLVSFGYVPFWMSEEQKLQQFGLRLMYEDIREDFIAPLTNFSALQSLTLKMIILMIMNLMIKDQQFLSFHIAYITSYLCIY